MKFAFRFTINVVGDGYGVVPGGTRIEPLFLVESVSRVIEAVIAY